MKYSKEVDFCEDIMKIIVGIFIGTKREKTIFIPEVPIGYWSNNQVDMLLLDIKNLEYLTIQLKLSARKSLVWQLKNTPSPVIGIINSRLRSNKHKEIYELMPEERIIFSYTGQDSELELLGSEEKGLLYKHRWCSVFYGLGMIYFWAYKNNKSDYRGGITSGNRDGYAKVYIKAIRNLHACYGKLDFMLTHATLSSGYSLSVSKKYYQEAIKG